MHPALSRTYMRAIVMHHRDMRLCAGGEKPVCRFINVPNLLREYGEEKHREVDALLKKWVRKHMPELRQASLIIQYSGTIASDPAYPNKWSEMWKLTAWRRCPGEPIPWGQVCYDTGYEDPPFRAPEITYARDLRFEAEQRLRYFDVSEERSIKTVPGYIPEYCLERVIYTRTNWRKSIFRSDKYRIVAYAENGLSVLYRGPDGTPGWLRKRIWLERRKERWDQPIKFKELVGYVWMPSVRVNAPSISMLERLEIVYADITEAGGESGVRGNIAQLAEQARGRSVHCQDIPRIVPPGGVRSGEDGSGEV